MTELEGWAIAVDKEGPLSHVDHTYVTSSDGKKWGCWGRDAGGTQICKGKGASGTASCLSSPGGTALIVYAVTGVCHQTANRILRPSRQTVSKAQGYAASWALYGAYGGSNRALDPAWKSHEAVCRLWDWRPDPVYLPEEGAQDQYFAEVHNAHSTMAGAIDSNRATIPEAAAEVRRLELVALVRSRLPNALTAGKLTSIANSRLDMLAELEPQLLAMTGPTSFIQAADRANKLLNAFLDSVANTLDAGEFRALFDVSPGTHVIVAEPETVANWIRSGTDSGEIQDDAMNCLHST